MWDAGRRNKYIYTADRSSIKLYMFFSRALWIVFLNSWSLVSQSYSLDATGDAQICRRATSARLLRFCGMRSLQRQRTRKQRRRVTERRRQKRAHAADDVTVYYTPSSSSVAPCMMYVVVSVCASLIFACSIFVLSAVHPTLKFLSLHLRQAQKRTRFSGICFL